MYIYEEVLALLVFISSYMALIRLCQRRSRGGEDLQDSRFEQLLACLSYSISCTLSFFPSLPLSLSSIPHSLVDPLVHAPAMCVLCAHMCFCFCNSI